MIGQTLSHHRCLHDCNENNCGLLSGPPSDRFGQKTVQAFGDILRGSTRVPVHEAHAVLATTVSERIADGARFRGIRNCAAVSVRDFSFEEITGPNMRQLCFLPWTMWPIRMDFAWRIS